MSFQTEGEQKENKPGLVGERGGRREGGREGTYLVVFLGKDSHQVLEQILIHVGQRVIPSTAGGRVGQWEGGMLHADKYMLI